MKKIFLLFSLFLALSLSLNAQVLFEENFDYTAGDDIATHGWTVHSGGTTNPIKVTAPGLTYPGYPSGTGNAASIVNTGIDVNAVFETVTEGDLYAAVLVKVDSARALGDYFFHFTVADITTNIFMGRLFVKSALNGNLCFGLSKTSTSATVLPVYSDSVFTPGTTYLAVIKYSFLAGDDSVKLFINPDLSQPEPMPLLVHGQSANPDPVNLGRVAIRQGGSSSGAYLTLDGIRVSKTWAGAVPVELTSFSANVVKGNVQLSWTTATETNNQGFDIERRAEGKSWSKIGYVSGNGTTTQPKNYFYADRNLSNGKYQYRLKQMDFDGTSSYSSVAEVNISTQITYELNQNYPNPFNPSTSISFSLPEAGFVTLKVYNMLGQEVRTLVSGVRDAGTHNVNFDAENLNSGLYLYKIEAGNFSQVKKMTLIK